MILLDTNILSELIRPAPAPAVLHWLAAQPAASVFIAADRRQAGRPISQADAQIAAIARSRGAALATRNVSDFEGGGVEIINPGTRFHDGRTTLHHTKSMPAPLNEQGQGPLRVFPSTLKIKRTPTLAARYPPRPGTCGSRSVRSGSR